MAVEIVATPGAANANSFVTVDEADAYFASRLPLTPPWDDAEDKTAALVMATRVLSSMAMPHRSLQVRDGVAYYITSRQWLGTPATTTQSLALPRIGLYDANGNLIAPTVIPQAAKDATSELAGQLVVADTTIENEISVAGITSVKAGSVAVTFKDMIERHVIPQMVWSLMPSWWFTDELYEPALRAQFDVFSS